MPSCFVYKASPGGGGGGGKGDCGGPLNGRRWPERRFERTYFFSFLNGRSAVHVCHFLSWYAATGFNFRQPGRALVIVEGATNETRSILREFLVPENVLEARTYSTQLKVATANEFLGSLPNDSLLMFPDGDEYFRLSPRDASESFVRGRMVDRVASDFAVRPLDAHSSISLQYPRRCHILAVVANRHKWLLVPATYGGRRTFFKDAHTVDPAPAIDKLADFAHYGFAGELKQRSDLPLIEEKTRDGLLLKKFARPNDLLCAALPCDSVPHPPQGNIAALEKRINALRLRLEKFQTEKTALAPADLPAPSLDRKIANVQAQLDPLLEELQQARRPLHRARAANTSPGIASEATIPGRRSPTSGRWATLLRYIFSPHTR